MRQLCRRCLNTALNKKNHPEITRGHKTLRSEAEIILDWTELNIIFDLTEILIDELYCEYRPIFQMFTDLKCLVSKISDYPLMFPAAPPDILSVDKAEEEAGGGLGWAVL